MGDMPQANAAEQKTNSSGPPGDSTTASMLHGPFFAGNSLDWTDTLPESSHVDLFRHADFAATTLGAMESWGPSLRMYTSMLFADSRGAVIFWGHDRVAFYNEAYAPCYGNMHPFQMGKPFRAGFSDVWDDVSLIFNQVLTTKTSVEVRNILFMLERNDYTEETYFVGQFIPLRGDGGEIEGIYNTVYESTLQVLHDRWRPLIDNIAAITPFSVEESLIQVARALEANPKDIPMFSIFTVDILAQPEHDNLFLHFSSGLKDNICAPESSQLETCDSGIVPYLLQAKNENEPLVLSRMDHEALFSGFEWQGFGETSDNIVILPLYNLDALLGFYVQGTNPRRHYDDASQQKIVDLARQIESKWVASVHRDESKRRELHLQRQASDSETRLRHMAQCAPLGMYQVTADLQIRYANDQFWDITGLSRDKSNVSDFAEIFAPEEKKAVIDGFNQLLGGGERLVREHCLNRDWSVPSDHSEELEQFPVWILSSSFPLITDGKVQLVMGYVSDISQQKWAESVQSHHADEAIAAKQRQEHFIDTTSHEMRNPLNAITQLADGIYRSLSITPQSTEQCLSVISDNVDAASTILACTSHQKRVIDDVLTLSRLEAQMMSITPAAEQPRKVLNDVMKMFETGFSTADIKTETRNTSVDALKKLDTVLLDRSRLTQILINFISNAIKFTSSAEERNISVDYGLQTQAPPKVSTAFGVMEWIDLPGIRSPPVSPARQNPQKLYLYFCITDTGIGMDSEEVKRLFHRFSQGSPRTHVEYGGSGLGLHICRELVQLQGGSVGVVSEKNKGSAFGFFIETTTASTLRSDFRRRSGYFSPEPSCPEKNQNCTERKSAGEISPELDDAETAQKSSSGMASTSLFEPEGLNVLLVEDNLVNQRVLAKQLTKRSCNVAVANHGFEALKFLKTTDCWDENEHSNEPSNPLPKVDVILMDWEMPKMDGLECTKRIRELEAEGKITKSLLIAGTTANVREEQIDIALGAGMNLVVGKPFTIEQLFESLRKYQERWPSSYG